VTNPNQQPPQPPPGHNRVNIQIDRQHYQVEAEQLTGEGLRALLTPPIPASRDLFLVVPGGDDLPVGLNDVIELKNGMRFFTAPAQINPGHCQEVPYALAR